MNKVKAKWGKISLTDTSNIKAGYCIKIGDIQEMYLVKRVLKSHIFVIAI